MVTLEFVFNKEKMNTDGLTTDELLAPMREYADKWNIDEPREVFFRRIEKTRCVTCVCLWQSIRERILSLSLIWINGRWIPGMKLTIA